MHFVLAKNLQIRKAGETAVQAKPFPKKKATIALPKTAAVLVPKIIILRKRQAQLLRLKVIAQPLQLKVIAQVFHRKLATSKKRK